MMYKISFQFNKSFRNRVCYNVNLGSFGKRQYFFIQYAALLEEMKSVDVRFK